MTAALLSPDEMAARLGVPVSTVMQWNRELSWPHVRMGRRYRWTEDQYDEIVRSRMVSSSRSTQATGRTARSAARRRSS